MKRHKLALTLALPLLLAVGKGLCATHAWSLCKSGKGLSQVGACIEKRPPFQYLNLEGSHFFFSMLS